MKVFDFIPEGITDCCSILCRGYNVFISNYSVGEDAKGFKPLLQLASTIAYGIITTLISA